MEDGDQMTVDGKGIVSVIDHVEISWGDDSTGSRSVT